MADSISVSDFGKTTDTSSLYESNTAMGKDEFLMLLTQQLKNQDPLSPMDNTQFVSQLAQFSALEAMQNLNTTVENGQTISNLSQSAWLIGLTATAKDTDTGETVSGIVKSVVMKDGSYYAVIDDTDVPIANITQVDMTSVS